MELRRRLAERRSFRLAVLAFACTAFAYAFLLQSTGPNQGAHYALVKALADGTPTIDRTRHEVGDLGTTDVAYDDGHVYAAKAPGLALVSVPAYLLADQAGVPASGDPTKMLWVLTLWGVVLPAMLVLVLLAWIADRFEPGLGAAAAIIAGLGTLVFPYATVYYAHMLSTALGFAAFGALFAARHAARPLPLILSAGVAAGLAVTTEYPLALLAVTLGIYVTWAGHRARRACAYLAGVAIGLAPLFAYNKWAFGSFVETPYSTTPVGPGDGLFGLGFYRPSLEAVLQILVGPIGLLRFGPVLACALAGLWLLAARGHRREAAAAAAVFVLYLLYNASYYDPLGGASAGPRFMIPALPFAALGLATALRMLPALTRLLGAVSLVILSVVVATHPLQAGTGGVLDRVRDGGFATTVLDYVTLVDWLDVIPFLAATGIAFISALAAAGGLAAVRDQLGVAAAGLAAWGAVSIVSPSLLEDATPLSELALAGLAVVACAAVVCVAHFRPARKLGAVGAGTT